MSGRTLASPPCPAWLVKAEEMMVKEMAVTAWRGLPPISKSLSVTMYSGWGEIKNGWVVSSRMVETLGGSN